MCSRSVERCRINETHNRLEKVPSRDAQANDETRVDFGTCECCVTGTGGGLCSHVFALLLFLERYRTTCGQTSLTSLPQSWAPGQRDAVREPFAKVVVERADIGRIGEPEALSHTLPKARRTQTANSGHGFVLSALKYRSVIIPYIGIWSFFFNISVRTV